MLIFPTYFLTQVMAETVGSIMVNHMGKGSYITEENFSKVLYLGEDCSVCNIPLNVVHHRV